MAGSASFEEVRDFLFSLKNQGSRYGIDRMRLLSAALGHPERAFPVIHVAGTNGKGSTSAMIEAILRAYGLRSGLYTSPHLVHLGERVQINRIPLTGNEILDGINRLRPVADRLVLENDPDAHPSFFEFITAQAF
jgi:dihydrofolate synthase/folylpolyglutamate synthase